MEGYQWLKNIPNMTLLERPDPEAVTSAVNQGRSAASMRKAVLCEVFILPGRARKSAVMPNDRAACERDRADV